MVYAKPTPSLFVDGKYTDVYIPTILSTALIVPEYEFWTDDCISCKYVMCEVTMAVTCVYLLLFSGQ